MSFMLWPAGKRMERIKKQAKAWYDFLEESPFKPLVKNPNRRSDTVIVAQAKPAIILEIKEKAKAENITLGNGYGFWKNDTFRIANFPAIEAWEIYILKGFLKRC